MIINQPKRSARNVAQMYVLCSLPMRPDAMAASDNCGKLAVGAVQNERGEYVYRCHQHLGLVTTYGGAGKNEWITGPSVFVIPGQRG